MKRFFYLLFLLLSFFCLNSLSAQAPGGKMYFADVSVFNNPGPNQGIVRFFRCGNASSVNITNGITMETWVKLTIPTDNQKIMGKVDADGGANFNDGYMLGINSSRINPEIWTPENQSFQEGFMPPVSSWHHIAVTYKVDDVFRGYLDGVMVHEQAAAGGQIVNDNSDLIVGIAPWDPRFFMTFGSLDEVRIWDVARTPAEIRNNMFKNLNGDEPGLVLYLNMDNDDGTEILEDLSSQLNHCLKEGMDETNILPSTCPLGNTATQAQEDLYGIWFASDPFLQDPRTVETDNGLSLSSFFIGQDSAAFVVWGHGGEAGVSTDALPPNAPANAQRTARSWRTTVYGDITPTLTFNLADAAGGGATLPNDKPASYYTLLQRNDDSEAFRAVAQASAINGDDVTFDFYPVEEKAYALAVADDPFDLVGLTSPDNNSLSAKVFPNPSNGSFTLAVQLPAHQKVQVQLFNYLGAEVYATLFSSLDRVFHFGLDLPKGMYVLRAQAGEATFNQRIIVQSR
ncbi:MAG: T9SS type A sorting domain-containing protein [Phaeodactylibacter sp.]|nr:T9SS type A sorting domain-containing protein [Phaeodactylibacter sp.]